MSIMQRELTTGIYLINLSGPLNAGQSEQVSRCFRDLFVRKVGRVVVNLAEVPFIDGPGLTALITGYKLFGNLNFRLVGLQDQPRLVLELTGFEHIFEILDRVAETDASQWSRQTWSGYTGGALTPQKAALVDMAA